MTDTNPPSPSTELRCESCGYLNEEAEGIASRLRAEVERLERERPTAESYRRLATEHARMENDLCTIGRMLGMEDDGAAILDDVHVAEAKIFDTRARLEQDRERIDWLEANRAKVSHGNANAGEPVYQFHILDETGHLASHPLLRKAIDAARGTPGEAK